MFKPLGGETQRPKCGKAIQCVDVMDRPIPKRNPKYKKVKAVLAGKTGLHIRNVKVQSIRKRPMESFRRLRGQELHELIEQSRMKPKENILNLTNRKASSDCSMSIPIASHDADPGESSLSEYDKNVLGREYLLLDIRDHEEFDDITITTAINFPIINARQDNFIKELYFFRGKSDKLIVVCASEKLEGIKACTLLAEKLNADNVYFLSSSIENYTRTYPYHADGKTALVERLKEIQISAEAMKSSRKLAGSVASTRGTSNSACTMRTWKP